MPLSRFSSAIRNTGIAFGWIGPNAAIMSLVADRIFATAIYRIED